MADMESIAARSAMYRRAHEAVQKATRTGALALPSTLACVDCGKPATEYDHRDYAEPLTVDPVCHSCNTKRGRALFSGLYQDILRRRRYFDRMGIPQYPASQRCDG